jgi:hypothetical protein
MNFPSFLLISRISSGGRARLASKAGHCHALLGELGCQEIQRPTSRKHRRGEVPSKPLPGVKKWDYFLGNPTCFFRVHVIDYSGTFLALSGQVLFFHAKLVKVPMNSWKSIRAAHKVNRVETLRTLVFFTTLKPDFSISSEFMFIIRVYCLIINLSFTIVHIDYICVCIINCYKVVPQCPRPVIGL